MACFIDKAWRHEPLVIHGDGGQTRDFIFVKDVVAAIRHVTLREDITGVFNAGSGRARTLRELAETIVALAGSSSALRHGPARAGDVRHSHADTRALAAAGFAMPDRFEEGLRETLAVYPLRGFASQNTGY